MWGLTGIGVIQSSVRIPLCPLPTASELGQETSLLRALLIMVTLVIAVIKSTHDSSSYHSWRTFSVTHFAVDSVLVWVSEKQGGPQDKELGQVFV